MMKIAENIRGQRKERKLTQEQLAEALGVTVGAVSKWESGASVPDIALIMEMANFFETSVDVLLGYEWKNGGMGKCAARIRALRNEKRFEEASAEAEKALTKYPNAFEIVFQSALQYTMRGVEQRSPKAHRRALALYERALELIRQNTDEHINEWTLRNNIASTYLCLGQTDEALSRMKANNADGLNNIDIGFTLVMSAKKPDEGLTYLSDALLSEATSLHRAAVAYANAYAQKGEYASAIEMLDWMIALERGLQKPDAPSYLTMEETQLLAARAIMFAYMGDVAGADKALGEAVEAANRFDAHPAYDFAGTRFYHSLKDAMAFDDFGDTALDGVKRTIRENEEVLEQLAPLWAKWTNQTEV